MTKQIEYIQNYLKTNKIDAYVIFTNDDHGSEYVVDHYKARAYISGFTGSAGTMVITQDGSYLWTDGRYFLQAGEQLKKTGTTLMKMGVEGEVLINDFLGKLAEKPRIALDCKLATVSFVLALKKDIPDAEIIDNGQIIDEIWTDRPAMVATKAYMLSDKVAGESISSKLARTLSAIKEQDCQYGLITSLDDISWLLNLRGDDIAYNPVNYAFFLLGENEKVLYIDATKLSDEIVNSLAELQITVKGYEAVYKDVKKIKDYVLIDASKTNYCLYTSIKHKKETIAFPTTVFKTIKNETEIRNMKKAHIEDAVAMIKFMYWLKTNVGKIEIDELSAQDKLWDFRKEGKDYLDLSFGTICGYGPNGAIVHYSSAPETNRKVEKGNLLLVDSGAQYRYGTTDITRTFALGKISKEMKHDFTLVLKSHIALASAVFPNGVNGYGLDVLAREPIFKEYKDFNHGTGHGVGYLLNVHEGPQRITMRSVNHETLYPILPGMVTSDEPGLYLTGKYGIRHENLVLTVEKEKNEFNTFYGFEPLTYVPFDLDGIDVSMLNQQEKDWLNNYHKNVRKKVSKYLSGKLLKYLEKVTKEI